jgi:hypothetical protein
MELIFDDFIILAFISGIYQRLPCPKGLRLIPSPSGKDCRHDTEQGGKSRMTLERMEDQEMLIGI